MYQNDNLDGRRIQMATISKESLAQFWLHALPNSIDDEYRSFSDSKIVEHLLEFTTEKNEEKKIFEMIKNSIQPKILKIKTPPKCRRSNKNTLANIDTNRIRFTVQIEVFEYEEEIPVAKIEDRSIESLSSLLHESDSAIISERFHALIYPWLIDVSFQISNEFFTLIVDLMNQHPTEFLLHCFVPWLTRISIENLHLFCSNLYTQLIHPSHRCQLCTYLCENSTSPWNSHQLCIVSQWFDSKEFYFSNELFNLLPGKLVVSATIFSADLPFAKVLHKILIKCTENQMILTDEQRTMFKQAITINTTILSDILMDLLD